MTRRHFRNFVFYPFSILVIIVITAWVAAPFIAKHYLSSYFEDQNQTSSIDALSIDFFPPKIDIKNLTLTDQSNDTLTLKLKRARFEVQIWPLFTRTLDISEANIDGLEMSIIQQEKDWIVAGINTSQYLENETTEESTSPEDKEETTSNPWNIKLPIFSFTNSHFTLSRQPELTEPAQQDSFTLEKLVIEEVFGQGTQWKGEISLSALINQATLSINSEFDYSPELVNADVKIQNTLLPISSFKHFTPEPYNNTKGQLSVGGQFQFQQTQVNSEPFFEIKGLTLNAILKELDLNLNDNDRITTQSTTLALTQSEITFASSDQLDIKANINLKSEQSSFTQADLMASYTSFNLSNTLSLVKNGDSLSAKNNRLEINIQDLEALIDNEKSVSSQTTVFTAEQINLDQKVDQIELTANIKLKSEQTSYNQTEMMASYESLDISNTLSLVKNGDDFVVKNSQLDTNIQDFKATIDDEKQLSLEQAVLTAEQINADIANQKDPSLTGTNLQFSSTSLDSFLSDKKRIASWQNAGFNSLSFTQQGETFSATLADFKVIDLTLSEVLTDTNNQQKLPPLSHIDSISIKNIEADQKGATIDSITTDAMKVSVIIDANKNLVNLIIPKESQPETAQQTKPKPSLQGFDVPKESDAKKVIQSTPEAEQNLAFKAPYYVALKTYDTTGDSSIYLQDKSTSPTLQRLLTIDTLSLRDVNTQDKDQATVFSLKARNGKYSTLNSDITILPLAEKLTMQSELVIKEAELPPYSSYIANALGYQIDSGQLDLDLTLNSDNGVLDGESHIFLRQFNLGGRQDSNSVIKAGAIPLNIAVGILKDSDDNIELDIPLSGDINNPEFGWTDFMILPIRKALYKVSSSYLMQTFVPYANVISIAQFAGEQLLKVRVEPLIFNAEDSQLNDSQDVFLQQLSTLMKDKKDSQLKACGITSFLDLGFETPPAALDDNTKEQAQRLAQERSENLKEFLVEQGIESSRILLCSPATDLSKSSKPRVELNF